MPTGLHRRTNLPMYYSGDVGTSELIRSLSDLNLRKEERERQARAEARQAELDRVAEEDRQRRIKDEEFTQRLAEIALKERLAAQTDPIPGTEVKIGPQGITLKEPPLPYELSGGRDSIPPPGAASGTPEEDALGMSRPPASTTIPLSSGFTGQTPDVKPFGEGEDLVLPSGQKMRVPFFYRPDYLKRIEEETKAKTVKVKIPDKPEFGPFAGGEFPKEFADDLIRLMLGKKEPTVEEEIARERALIDAGVKTDPRRSSKAGSFSIEQDEFGNPRVFNRQTGQFVGGTTGGTSPFAGQNPLVENAARSAISKLPAERQKSALKEINRRLKAGDEQSVKDYIIQVAFGSELADTQKDVRAREETLAILDNVGKLLEQVPTGFIEGTIEDTVRKIGKTTDPRYAAIGNQLKSALFAYRKAMTGVQFSARESADYEKMFPNYRNDLPVNQALIQGLIDGFSIRNNVFWQNKLGKREAEHLGLVRGTSSTGLGETGGPPTVSSQAEYDALPSGTTFVDAKSGKKFRKP